MRLQECGVGGGGEGGPEHVDGTSGRVGRGGAGRGGAGQGTGVRAACASHHAHREDGVVQLRDKGQCFPVWGLGFGVNASHL